MKNKVLVMAVHPDDETLGCGGTILKHKKNGDKVYYLLVTRMTKEDGFSKKIIQKREKEIKKICNRYDFDGTFELELSTTKVDRYPIADIIKKISEVVNRVKPSVIYLPFMGDAHSDHRIMFNSFYSCVKAFRYPFIKKIFMAETISETEFSPSLKDYAFLPNYFVNISDFMEEKVRIMKVFNTEMGKHPFPRSEKNIRALATFRGSMSGCNYAESFMLLKEIW